MIKQNQFYVYKLKSSRLYEGKYDIKLDLQQSRKYKELIQLGDNQILKSLRKLKGSNIDFKHINDLKKEKNKLLKNNTQENKKRIVEIQNELDSILFVPEYIAVVINKTKEYDRMFKLGFKVNGKVFKRFSCSSSQGRVNTVIFIQEEYNEKLKTILKNGIDENIKLVPNKMNAYFGLNSSCIYEVETPRVCVIPDKEIEMTKTVDFIDENDSIIPSERKVVTNLWDGQGIISPRMSKIWAKKCLKIYDYIPSYYIIRSSWVKGALFTFDFHKFAREIAKKDYIVDIYGNTKKISECDILITESMFKMWKNYLSWEDYVSKSNENELVWGVTRVAPKTVNDYITTNYQFIQTLDLNDEDIKGLLKPTIDWIDGVLNNNPIYTMLFMNGSFDSVEESLNSLQESENSYVKALMHNLDMIEDVYIKKKVNELIKKKIQEAMLGKILIDGNFQIMCSDPFCLCEHAFGMDVKGLLNEHEHYSDYWNKKHITKVDAMRSPLTWKSEHNILNLKNELKHKKWYEYLQGCIVYNVWGSDCMRHADGDFDGDLVCTTSNKYFLKESDANLLPITYDKNVAEKVIIDDESILMEADKQSFNSRIGKITNVSTKLYAVLAEFNKGTEEYNEIIRRLKLLRKEQGNEIDRAKGVKVKSFNTDWTIYNSIDEKTDSEIVKNRKEFNNRILADKKPYFMIYLYNSCKKEYVQYVSNCNTYSQVKFGITLNELLNKKNKEKDEIEYIEHYYKHMPVNDSDCTMNRLCKYVEKVNKLKFKIKMSKGSAETVNLMIDNEIPFDSKVFSNVKSIFGEYNKYKHDDLKANDYEIDTTIDTDNKEDYNSYNNINEFFRRKLYSVCSNINELANYAVRLCYIENNPSNKDFAWKLCETGLLENIKKNSGGKLYIPVIDKNGQIEYLGNKYRLDEATEDMKEGINV